MFRSHKWRSRLTAIALSLISLAGAGAATATGASAAETLPAAIPYFSPFPLGQYEARGPDAVNIPRSAWSSAVCDYERAYNAAKSAAGGEPITGLAGWSLGRAGAINYLIAATPIERQTVRNVLLVDPGTLDELSGSCDGKLGGGQWLAIYLAQDPTHTLTILAGDVTADVNVKDSQGRAHQGIQQIYFNPIRDYERSHGVNLSDQVLVCNYSMPGVDPNNHGSLDKSHKTIVQGASGVIGGAPLTACPDVYGMTFQREWRP